LVIEDPGQAGSLDALIRLTRVFNPTYDKEMEGRSVFDTLVSHLGMEERRTLLERLKASEHQISLDPIYEIDEQAERASIQALFQASGLWEHLVCVVTGFFTRQTSIDVYGQRLLRSLQYKYVSQHPGMADFQRAVLGPRFHDELLSLKAASRFLYSSLEASIERDKAAFIAYLGSTELSEAHHRLMTETDVFAIGEANPFWDNQMVLRQCLNEMDNIVATICEDDRNRMYRNIRSLSCLKKLSGFPFDHFLSFFKNVESGKPECPLSPVTSYLADLADILYSLSDPPSLELLETVFLFPRQDLLNGPDAALESEVSGQIEKAGVALDSIRRFIGRVGLIDLLRASLRDMGYRTRQLSGGEDWFSVYKGFWKERIESSSAVFARERGRLSLIKEIEEFLGQNALKELENVAAFTKESGYPVKQAFILSFILSAFDSVFVDDINRPLKLLLLEAEFYRNENRIEYTDAYSVFVKITDSIRSFDRRLARDGDLGILFSEAQCDYTSINSKQYKLLEVQQAVAFEADKIVQEIVHALRTGLGVLKGILYPQQGNKYDSIQNLRMIEGRQNSSYVFGLEKAKDKLERILSVIILIADAESIKLEL
jgi:hypothetical protein